MYVDERSFRQISFYFPSPGLRAARARSSFFFAILAAPRTRTENIYPNRRLFFARTFMLTRLMKVAIPARALSLSGSYVWGQSARQVAVRKRYVTFTRV